MRTALFAALFALAASGAARAEPVMLISIDGLRPGDVIEAEQRGLHLPNLTRFLREGSYATGVVGVLPTVTYPSHTTLITGVSPARHGVVNNTTFDPGQINHDGWFWYTEDIKVPTLWSAAAARGMSVANVHWPVSVGASAIRWNLPQIWRTGHGDDAKLLRALASPGLIQELEAAGSETYADGIAEDVASDENRGRFAARLVARHRPDFITVYLTALDHEQHMAGPGSQSAHLVLERLDAVVGKLVAAELAVHPDAAVAVVSDHGFAPIDHEVNLFHQFIDAGLITLDEHGKVASWDAMPWNSGGSIAVVLARPDDLALASRVRSVLERLKAALEARIEAIIDAPQIAGQGGNPRAAFYLDLKPGTTSGGYSAAERPLESNPHYNGMHGYFPAHPEMRSTFMIMGPGIARARALGEIDMRSIAPTLAQVIGARLDAAEVPAMSLRVPNAR